MLTKLALLSACFLAVIPRPARGATINVVVGGTGTLAYTPNQVTAQPGDVIQFTFKQKNHTITQSSLANPCSPLAGGFDSGFVPVAADETDFPLAQLRVKDTNPIWIYCKQANHCQQGMVFAVNGGDKFGAFEAAAKGLSPPASSVVSSSTPTSSSAPSAPSTPSSSHHVVTVGASGGLTFSPANITAQPGDLVTFTFATKNHTVTQSSFSDPCRPISQTSAGQAGFDSGFMFVDPSAATLPTFTIQINDTSPIWIYCRQAGHCGKGMVASINSVETGPNTFDAFKAKAIQLNGTSASNSSPAAPSQSNGAENLLSTRGAGLLLTLGALAVGLAL